MDVVELDGSDAGMGGGRGRSVLILGGARSGKSEVAERMIAMLAPAGATVTYVATGSSPEGEAADPQWEARIRRHRERRPPAWETVELEPGGDLAGCLTGLSGPVIVDSLGTWLAGLPGFDASPAGLAACLARRRYPTVIVSDEVGMSVHPEGAVGREFRDALGKLNSDVAAASDHVYLVVAGRLLELPTGEPAPAQPLTAHVSPLAGIAQRAHAVNEGMSEDSGPAHERDSRRSGKAMISGLGAAFGLLSILPGGSGSPGESATWFFPVTGIVLGGVTGLIWWGLAQVLTSLVAGVLVVGAGAAVTGMLHLDGLADSADGLFLPGGASSPASRARRLAVMSDSRLGSFGAVSLLIVLLAQIAALARLQAEGSLATAPLLLAGLWCISRSGMAVVVRSGPYAREASGGGMASVLRPQRFLAGRTRGSWHADLPGGALGVAGIVAGVGLGCAWHLLAGGISVGAVIVAFIATIAFGVRRLGGFTGDLLGAAGVVAETVGLLVAAGWR